MMYSNRFHTLLISIPIMAGTEFKIHFLTFKQFTDRF